jgi:hypothetical protein
MMSIWTRGDLFTAEDAENAEKGERENRRRIGTADTRR